MDFALKLVEKHKIQRVLLLSHWLIYWCDNLQESFSDKAKCKFDNVDGDIAEMMMFVKKLQKLGAEISVVTIDLDV